MGGFTAADRRLARRAFPLRRFRTILALPFLLVLGLALASPRPLDAQTLGRGGHDDGLSSTSPVARLLARMSSGQWVKISGPDQGHFNAARPPFTCKYFDGLAGAPCGGTFPNDDQVKSANGGNKFAYSAPGCDQTRYCLMAGGGHAASDDSSIQEFDYQQAARSVLTGGPGGDWKLLVYPGRELPCTAPIPAWSGQTRPGCPGDYVITTDINGYEHALAAHNYDSVFATPGGKFVIAGEGYANIPGTASGSYDVVDPVTGVTYVQRSLARIPAGCDARNRTTTLGATLISGDALLTYTTLYKGTLYSGGGHLCRMTNLVTGTPAWVNVSGGNITGEACSTGIEGGNNIVLFPDPVNGGDAVAAFFYCTVGPQAPNGHFQLALAATSGAAIVQCSHDRNQECSFAVNALMHYTPQCYLSWQYDPKRRRIVVTDANPEIFYVKPTATPDPRDWTITKDPRRPTGYRGPGDIPACSGKIYGGGSNFVHMTYLAREDAYLIGVGGDWWLRKP